MCNVHRHWGNVSHIRMLKRGHQGEGEQEPLPGKPQVGITISVNSTLVQGLALGLEPCWVRTPTAEPLVWQTPLKGKTPEPHFISN